MNRIAVAQELVKLAKELVGADLQSEIADIAKELTLAKNDLAVGGMPSYFRHNLEEKVKGIRKQTKDLLKAIAQKCTED